MSSNIEYLLQLHRNGVITDDDLRKGIRALKLSDEPSSKQEAKSSEPKESPLEKLRRKRREKKRRRKQRRDLARAEATVAHEETQELADTAEASQNLKLVDKPLCNYFKTYEINAEKYRDPSILFENKKSLMIDQINKDIKEYKGIKFSVGLSLEFFKDEKDGTRKYFQGQKHGEQSAVLHDNNVEDLYNEQVKHIEKNWIENFTNQEGTGAAVNKCIKLYLNIAKYEPLKGSSYMPLPNKIANKKAVINVKNDDNRCIEWALKSALYPAKNNVSNKYTYTKYDLNLEGIVDFPTPVSQISKVEKHFDLAINVYGYTVSKKLEKLNIFPYHISEKPKEKERINLLLISEDVNDKNEKIIETKSHYCWIKNLNRLLFDQNKCKNKTYFCDRCLYGFTKEDLLIKHKEDCYGINKNSTRIQMPTEGKSHIKFKNYQNQMPVPYVIYADFESIIKPKTEKAGLKSDITSEHEACGFGYQIVRYDGVAESPVIYRGKDVAETFLNHLECEVNKINNIFAHPKPLIMTEQNKTDYENATHCWICEKEIGESKNNPKVRDHCHFTGKYRGAAHKSCNLKLKINPGKTKIPVVFHNLKGYDSHFIIQKLHTTKGNITCIANNAEKYISFSVAQRKFLDSFQFMASSLEKLVQSTIGSASICPKCQKETEETTIDENWLLTAQCTKCKSVRTKQLHKSDLPITVNNASENAHLIAGKGFYPYEYIDSHERFKETELPPMEAFYSKLTNETISAKNYEHAQTVWKKINCQTLGDYHDLYLKSDVLLLADVFQTFRKTCMEAYKLDPLHYYTAPGLSWDALLKYTKIDLELLTDMDMHLFIEKGMRGGISMVSKRHAKANNPYTADYDSKITNNYIMYYDANNLYGWAMSQPLPYSGFKWYDMTDKSKFKKPKDKGWILEVDLEYPKELHDLHNDYPLAPEKLTVQKEWLSDYQTELIGDENMVNVSKLVPNLMNKKKYVVHYRNLNLYMQLGMKVTKVHRILEFNEKPWMEPYIRLNTEFRKKAQSAFEKDFYKLMNNSVFGKTMENLRKRVDIKLVKTDGSENEKLRKIIAKPNFNRRIKFSDELSAIHVNKTSLTLNKPIYVGFSVLDLSKHLMYDWYYNKLKKKYGENCTLLYTDTDSLLVDIKTEDVYKDMTETKEEYDFSDYPKDHPLFDETNKKVLGKMKDECAGAPISEYIGLRPKLYSILRCDDQIIKKAKGTKKYVINKHISFENYKDALFNKQKYTHEMNMLRSKHHKIYGITVNKTTLSPLDTKRFIAPDGIMTYAYGYSQFSFHNK